MRILVLTGLLLLGAATVACAQQRDTTTRRDTLSRRDTARTRADSVLQRELERIRGEPRRPVPPGAAGPQDTLAFVGQDTSEAPAVRVFLELGAVLGHDVYRTSAVETESGTGALLRGGVEYRFRWGLGTFATLGGAVARVSATEAATERSGTATQIDLMAGVSWRPPIRQSEPEPVRLHLAGGGAWISGPDDVSPYPAIADEDQPFGIWEVGVSVRPGRRAISGVAAFQSVRVLPSAADEDSRANRVILALRLGS